MLSLAEKHALDKIKMYDNIEGRLNSLLEEINRKLQPPQEIIDIYIRQKKEQLRKEKESFDRQVKDIELKINREKEKFEKEKLKQKRVIDENHEAIERLYKEKSQGFPWLAKAYADYSYLHDHKIANYLRKKSHPAKKAAAEIKAMAARRRESERKFRITKYLLDMYESLFPFLIDFKGEDLDDYIRIRLDSTISANNDTDGVDIYTTDGERENLTKPEIFQRALDRYWIKKKSPWELGRDYERYVGYLYEQEGYSVYYQGIVEGLEDLGRDLIGKKDNEVVVIQCKRWARHKTIHEKHVAQLFGTTLKYWIENRNTFQQSLRLEYDLFPKLLAQKQVKGVFVTSTTLSQIAKEFAHELGIEVKENFEFRKYPSIKCNVSRITGEKIYHLPFDQQYDRAIIEEERNECYAETIEEAENLGFRRAYRWRGDKD